MYLPRNDFLSWGRVALFLLAGGFATLVNLVSRYLLTPVVGYEASIVIAYLVGMLVAFCLFRTLVFGRSSSKCWR